MKVNKKRQSKKQDKIIKSTESSVELSKNINTKRKLSPKSILLDIEDLRVKIELIFKELENIKTKL
jgi:hypothetical protein